MTDRKKFGELVSQYVFKETSSSNIDLLDKPPRLASHNLPLSTAKDNNLFFFHYLAANKVMRLIFFNQSCRWFCFPHPHVRKICVIYSSLFKGALGKLYYQSQYDLLYYCGHLLDLRFLLCHQIQTNHPLVTISRKFLKFEAAAWHELEKNVNRIRNWICVQQTPLYGGQGH